MNNNSEAAVTNAWAITLAILALLAFCWMTKRQPVDRDAILRARIEAAAEDPDDRKLRIEKALTVQRVIGCDTDGNLQLGSTVHEDEETDASTDEEKPGALCHDNSTPTESSCCCICLEVYQVGETVAWNRQRRCLHVFHQDCLAEWLLKHNDCPTCRLPIVPADAKSKVQPNADSTSDANPAAEEQEDDPTDRENQNDDPIDIENQNEEDDISVASASSTPGAFAIVHGLIARVRGGLNNNHQQAQSGSVSPTLKMESPAIFRRRVIGVGGDGDWTRVRASSSSTASSSDEENGLMIQRVASVNDTSCVPSSGAALQIVQTTQPWMADSLLSDGGEDVILDDERSS